jgi:hypothetical protein
VRQKRLAYPDTLSLQELVVLLFDTGRVDENDGLGSSLRNVFVLQLLTVAEAIDLIEMSAAFERLCVTVGRSDDSEPSSGNVSESAVEAVEISSVGEEDAEGNFFLFRALKVFW